MIINENSFVNLIAMSRFLPFSSITERNCIFNNETFKKLKKDIAYHTLFYGFMYVLFISFILLTNNVILKAFFSFVLIVLILTSLWAYIGFKLEKISTKNT